MEATETATETKSAAAVGSSVWVLHDDDHEGYEVSLHATEAGAYEAVLDRIERLVKHGVYDDEEEALFAAVKAKDGRAALKAHEDVISGNGQDAAGNVCLWVTEQKVEK